MLLQSVTGVVIALFSLMGCPHSLCGTRLHRPQSQLYLCMHCLQRRRCFISLHAVMTDLDNASQGAPNSIL
jgi:hypothetical protein